MGADDMTIGGSQELVRQLRRLAPAGHTIDRDTLMFRAGQRATRPRLHLWQSLAGATMLLAAGLGWLSFNLHESAASGGARLLPSYPAADDKPARRQPRPTGFMAVAPGLTDRLSSGLLAGQDRAPASDYLELRWRVMLEGMDALPAPGWAPVSPAPVQTIADWLRLPGSSTFPSDPFDSSGAVTKGNPS